ncbi:aminotransferase class IV [Pseudophaeobacter arcticus]|uniref:aminotransferase class IV n=1 Tax=Pseudophaeobacter arcticus TaxID=385492 RepID=UPI00248FE2B8|nr:aminotransferase class IV [Pseudophaeobacter arcticus]
MTDTTLHYFNGKFVQKHEIQFSIDDVGLLRGYSVFDFFKAKGEVPIFIDDHLARLNNSAEKLNLKLPISEAQIRAEIAELLRINRLDYSSLKIIITGGESSNGFSPGESKIVILNMPFLDLPDAVYQSGASLMLNEYTRDFPEVKSTHYARALSLQAEWINGGHIDVLYHEGDFISEVSRSNVFYFEGNKLRTNQVGVLHGVTRKNVLKCAEGLYDIKIGPISLKDLLNADEVFITSSTKKVMPIVKVGDQEIGTGLVGEKTKHLMIAFDQYIDRYVAENS